MSRLLTFALLTVLMRLVTPLYVASLLLAQTLRAQDPLIFSQPGVGALPPAPADGVALAAVHDTSGALAIPSSPGAPLTPGTTVPEPASAALLGTGMLGLAVVVLRRRARTA